jgi:hypothetical protein
MPALKAAAAISRSSPSDDAASRQVQHAGHGAGARCADEQAQGARVAAQQIAREHRHQRSVRRCHEADEGHQPDQVAARCEVPGEAHGLRQSAQPVLHGAARPRSLQPHGGERGQHGEVGRGIEQEAPSLAGCGQDEAGQRRADQPRGVHHQGIQRDGIGQVLAGAHHFQQKSLPKRRIEGVNDAEEGGGGKQVPDFDEPGKSQSRQDGGL